MGKAKTYKGGARGAGEGALTSACDSSETQQGKGPTSAHRDTRTCTHTHTHARAAAATRGGAAEEGGVESQNKQTRDRPSGGGKGWQRNQKHTHTARTLAARAASSPPSARGDETRNGGRREKAKRIHAIWEAKRTMVGGRWREVMGVMGEAHRHTHARTQCSPATGDGRKWGEGGW